MINTITFYQRALIKDEYGNQNIDYINPEDLVVNITNARGKLLYEMYGNRLNYIKILHLDKKYLLSDLNYKEADAVAINSQNPNYQIISIMEYNSHYKIECDKL